MDVHAFHFIDLIGTFVFAISGAMAGLRRRLDPFGLFVVAFITACGGGVIRDLCIGALPPAGLVNIEYFGCVVLAVLLTLFFRNGLLHLQRPALFFDAVGLGFFAAFGVHKVYSLIPQVELAMLLGVISAVGGGMLRDILLGGIPSVLTREIYASAALLGAAIQLTGELGWIDPLWSTWLAIGSCTLLRMFALHYGWNLPGVKRQA